MTKRDLVFATCFNLVLVGLALAAFNHLQLLEAILFGVVVFFLTVLALYVVSR